MRVLAVLSFALLALVATACAARADDYGPHKDIREIRGAIPVLLASRVRAYKLDPGVLRVDDVVVNGDEAVARWNADGQAGLAGLARTYGTWWLTGEIDQAAPPEDRAGNGYWESSHAGSLPVCAGYVPLFGAATDNLIRTLHVSEQTAAVSSAHIEIIRASTADEQKWVRPEPIKPSGLEEECYQVRRTDGRQVIATSDAADYVTTLLSAKDDAVNITRFTGRAPTAGEFPPSPGANAMYFFSFEIGGPAPAVVTNGTLDVWCPFVLDPSQRYSLTIDYVKPAVGPIDGTLFDNTLHFDLPAFTVQPNTSAMGEIDFLPPRS